MLANVRRKFYDIHVANGSAIASEAIERMGALYDIEQTNRCEQTQTHPLMDAFIAGSTRL